MKRKIPRQCRNSTPPIIQPVAQSYITESGISTCGPQALARCHLIDDYYKIVLHVKYVTFNYKYSSPSPNVVIMFFFLSFLGSTAQLRPWPPPQNPTEFLGGFSTPFFLTG
jgi:hypothetical protein